MSIIRSTSVTATFSRPADNTAYTAGDHIANSTTGSAVVPMKFPLLTPRGRVTGARCVVTPASSTLVITALKFDLLLYRPESSIPYADGSFPADNAAFVNAAANLRELVAVLPFVATAWRNPAGALTAGASGYQDVKLAGRDSAAFDIGGLSPWNLIGVLQVLDTWTPTGIVNRFDLAVDFDFTH